MADEAFALSPISARAALPSEADYDAIREAFMETSRGRWFLGEYAKRNRNADTAMVLDAVARIEDTLAAQKKPVRDPSFDEALASLRTVLCDAREAAKTALADLSLEENLAPVRKGTRVIREIAWRLREIGADGRICDLIDSQINAIEGSAGKLATADLAAALSGAFDRIEARIAAFDAGDAAATPPPPAEASPSAGFDEAPGSAIDASASAAEAPASTVSAATIEADIEVSKTKQAEAFASPAEAVTTIEPVAEEAAAPALVEATGEPADAFDANDEALLDMVALEMGAPDTDAAYEPPLDEMRASESYEIDVTFEPRNPEAKSEAETSAPERPAVAAVLPAVSPLQPAPETVLTSEPKPEAKPEAKPQLKPIAEPSLGSSLLSSGIVSRPRTKPDPLAPIRRMSQTEKIAFFS
jgi:hypothetical protein